ncbi:MAG TPA: hypothetical protein VFS43_07085 [Polyangiaceae bacterium]|nr:hypothetical protein [Polyangiaceae bacterium]
MSCHHDPPPASFLKKSMSFLNASQRSDENAVLQISGCASASDVSVMRLVRPRSRSLRARTSRW